MEDIDKVVINFDDSQMFLMNIVLGLLMFGVALNLKLQDFKYLLERPKGVIIGLISQLILLPLFTLLLIVLFQPSFTVALGMILIASCPGGNISNYFVFRAGGNTPLSIALTSIVTVAAVVLTPISFFCWTHLLDKPADFTQSIHVDFSAMMTIIVQLILLPLALGMLINHYLPRLQRLIARPMKLLSVLLLLGIILVALKDNLEIVKHELDQIFFLVLVHNGIAYLLGYQWAYRWGLSKSDARAIAIETGIQNGGLALVLIFNYFHGLGGLALVAAWWGIWDIISGFALSTLWSVKTKNS